MDLLERLRTKPHYVKTRYAFLVALSVTFLILVVWVSTLPARFAELSIMQAEHIEGTPEGESLGDLFDNTKDQLGAVVESAKDTVPKAPEETPTVYDPLQNFEGTGGGETRQLELPVATSTETTRVIIATTSTQTQAEKAVTAVPPPTKPRVILIATTTSQKSE